jgi:hypothetical protein
MMNSLMFTGNRSLAAMISGTQPGEDTPVNIAFSLGIIYSNLDPNSQEAQGIKNRVAALNNLVGGPPPALGEETPVNLAFTKGVYYAQLDPNSQEAKQIKAQLPALNRLAGYPSAGSSGNYFSMG